MKKIILALLTFMLSILINGCNKSIDRLNLENSVYYSNKFTSYLGDSITQLSNNIHGYIQLLDKHFNFAASYNCGISGTTIANNGTNTSFYEDIRVNSIPSNSDYIFIYGGINDCWQNLPIGNISLNNNDVNTTVGAYNTLLNKLEKNLILK